MDPKTHDIEALSTCTSCQFTEDFSNYWTATLFFRARNGSLKRVPQIPQAGMEATQGGMVSILLDWRGWTPCRLHVYRHHMVICLT
jgi:hypothetical protein